MRLFDVHVRLNGDLLNVAPKFGVTVAELALLEAIHGKGSIVEIQEAGRGEDRSERDELDRLRMQYDRAHKKIDDVRREYGGTLPTDIHVLLLEPTQFHLEKVPAKRGRPPASETSTED